MKLLSAAPNRTWSRPPDGWRTLIGGKLLPDNLGQVMVLSWETLRVQMVSNKQILFTQSLLLWWSLPVGGGGVLPPHCCLVGVLSDISLSPHLLLESSLRWLLWVVAIEMKLHLGVWGVITCLAIISKQPSAVRLLLPAHNFSCCEATRTCFSPKSDLWTCPSAF